MDAIIGKVGLQLPRAKHSAQVIVVGASLSGLQAAYDLQQAGISCLILEARDRIGGNSSTGPGNIHSRGSWIDPVQQPRAWNLVHDLGLEMTEKTGKSVMHGFGAYGNGTAPFSDEADRRSYIRVSASIQSLSQGVDLINTTLKKPDYEYMTVQDLVITHGATTAIQKLADSWTAALFGVAACDVAALNFLLVCKIAGGFLNVIDQSSRGHSRMRFRGTPTLCEALAQRLTPGSVMLSQAVRWVDQTSNTECALTTATGDTFECSRVILAVPTSAYRDIELSPPLDGSRQWIQAYEDPGFYAEIVLVYDQPWWREKGLSGYSQSTEGPIWETHDTSRDADGVYALTCVIAGESGRELWKIDIIERRSMLLSYLGDVFSMFTALPDPIWRIEPKQGAWARSSPCAAVPTDHMGPGQWEAEDKVHFAGAETSYIWRGHIEGALASGSRASDEVLDALRPVEKLLLARL
ncbi:hypothetical protein FSARC_13119 [Fusarium sarcochroum]|uniref:Amine oxidase n=1 Tax=Fusarium sarcochroum TaxID=1208366 RepID=A0A8H4WUA4_9HYPO|nr:hypothetical protein FSARC_13119 [Fusarium sarcochroum]